MKKNNPPRLPAIIVGQRRLVREYRLCSDIFTFHSPSSPIGRTPIASKYRSAPENLDGRGLSRNRIESESERLFHVYYRDVM